MSKQPGIYLYRRSTGSPEATLPLFKHIIIVTNQRGVGKGIMTRKDLEEIHAYMINEVSGQGGRIDKIYVCTDTSDHSKNRKPNTGMALQAKDDFPDIDFTKSIMAGDSISDMLFAKKCRDEGSIYRKQIYSGEVSKTLYQAIMRIC